MFFSKATPMETSDANRTLLITRCTPVLTSPENTLSTASLSNLTLYPAPGEEFNLDISVMDELMNVRDATLSVTVSELLVLTNSQ